MTISSPIKAPADLADLPGISVGFDPPSVNRGRYLITGRHGTGKSTLVNSNPKAFILDPNKGGNTVDDPQAIRFTPDPDKIDNNKHGEAYLAMVDKLITRRKAGKKDIELIAIDNLEDMVDIFVWDLCALHGVDDPIIKKDGVGNIYTRARHQLFDMLDRAHKAGFGWVLLAGAAPKTITVGGEEKVVQTLVTSDSFGTAARGKCEHMMFMEYCTKTTTTPTPPKMVKGKSIPRPPATTQKTVRVLKTKPGGLWKGESTSDIKVRIPLPNSLEIPRIGGWETFSNACAEAIETLTGTKQKGPNNEQ